MVVYMEKQNIIYPSLIDNLPSDNFLFSVVGSDNEHFYSVIMNHYINMSSYYSHQYNNYYSLYKDSYMWNQFKNLDVVYFSRAYVEKNVDQVFNLFRNLIFEGYCILSYINMFYIPLYKSSYHQNHVTHEIMLYGYDDETQLFACQDYFSGIYEQGKVSAGDLLQAIKNYDETNYPDYSIGIVAIKRREPCLTMSSPYILRSKLIEEIENDYYSTEYICTGVGIFDAMKSVLTNDINTWRPDAFRRFFQFLQDNVLLMSYRLKYLQSQYSISPSLFCLCDGLKQKCRIYHNMFLKIELKEKTLLVTKDILKPEYIDYLEQLKMDYIFLLKNIIEQII